MAEKQTNKARLKALRAIVGPGRGDNEIDQVIEELRAYLETEEPKSEEREESGGRDRKERGGRDRKE